MNCSEFFAYSGRYTGLEIVMRLSGVTRWHKTDTLKQENLASHSAEVALLAYYIAKTSPDMFYGPSCHVATVGLLHDIAETITGDIPSDVKTHLSGIEELESAMLPAVFIEHTDKHTKDLVKLCDLACAIRFLNYYGIGPIGQHARSCLFLKLSNKMKEVREEMPTDVYLHVHECIFFYSDGVMS